MGRFAAVADADSGRLFVIDIPTGDVIEDFHIGRRPGRVLISPDGQNLYVKTWVKFSLQRGGKEAAILQRYVIERDEQNIHLRAVVNRADYPDYGRELRLSPDGELLFWFNPRSGVPVNVLDAETLEHLYQMRARGWRTIDMVFGDDPEKIYVHFAMSGCNGVAIVDFKGIQDYGEARLYNNPGWIAPVTSTMKTILFSAGTDRVIRFKIYPAIRGLVSKDSSRNDLKRMSWVPPSSRMLTCPQTGCRLQTSLRSL